MHGLVSDENLLEDGPVYSCLRAAVGPARTLVCPAYPTISRPPPTRHIGHTQPFLHQDVHPHYYYHYYYATLRSTVVAPSL